MTKTNGHITLELSFSAVDPRRVVAAYIRFIAGKVARTVEVVPDVLFADYDSKGDLMGLELLGPISAAQLESEPLSIGIDRVRAVEATLMERAREFLVPRAA